MRESCRLSQSADDEQSESDDEAAGANPVVEVPATLLRLPVAGQTCGRPELGAVVDRDRADEREEDGEDLDGEGNLGEVAGEHAEMFEGQQQEQVQQRGGSHPEWHDAAEERGEGGTDGDVHVKRLAVQRGMAECGDVQLTAAHQAEDDDCEYLKNHTDFDVVQKRESHNFALSRRTDKSFGYAECRDG
jgi:hypothetical protein